MVDFMNQFIYGDREACDVAVQLLRHKLMHTGEPRIIRENSTGQRYKWLLHWADQIQRNDHFKFQTSPDPKILNTSLLYLIEDLRKGIEEYRKQLAEDAQLQNNYLAAENQLERASFQFVP